MRDKKLYRIPNQGKVAGVSAGLAEFVEIDVTLVRLVMLALIMFTGIIPGLIFYLLAIWLMPIKEESHGKEHKA